MLNFGTVDNNIFKTSFSFLEHPPPMPINILHNNHTAHLNICSIHRTEQFYIPSQLNYSLPIHNSGFIVNKWTPKDYLLPEIVPSRFKEFWITSVPKVRLARRIPREVIHWKKKLLTKTHEAQQTLGSGPTTSNTSKVQVCKSVGQPVFLVEEKLHLKNKTFKANSRNLTRMGNIFSNLRRPEQRYDFRVRSHLPRYCSCGRSIHLSGRDHSELRRNHKDNESEDDQDTAESADGRSHLLPRELPNSRSFTSTRVQNIATDRGNDTAKNKGRSSPYHAGRFEIRAGERRPYRGRRSSKIGSVDPSSGQTARRSREDIFSHNRTSPEERKYQKHKMETRSVSARKVGNARISQAADQMGHYSRTCVQSYLSPQQPAHHLHGNRTRQTDQRGTQGENPLYQNLHFGETSRPKMDLGQSPDYISQLQKYDPDFVHTFPRRGKNHNQEETLQISDNFDNSSSVKNVRIQHHHHPLQIYDLASMSGQCNRKHAVQKSMFKQMFDGDNQTRDGEDDILPGVKERPTYSSGRNSRVQWKRAAYSSIGKTTKGNSLYKIRKSRASQKDLESLGDITHKLLHLKDEDGDKAKVKNNSWNLIEDVQIADKSNFSRSAKKESDQTMICLEESSTEDNSVPCLHLDEDMDNIIIIEENTEDVMFRTDEVQHFKCGICGAPGPKTWRQHCASCALKKDTSHPQTEDPEVSLSDAMKLFSLSPAPTSFSSLDTFDIKQDTNKESVSGICTLKPFPILQSLLRGSKQCPSDTMVPGHMLPSSAPPSRSTSEPFLGTIPQLDGHGGEGSDDEETPESELEQILRYHAEINQEGGVHNDQQQAPEDTEQQRLGHLQPGAQAHAEQQLPGFTESGFVQHHPAATAAAGQMQFANPNVEQGQVLYSQTGFMPTNGGQMQPGPPYYNMCPPMQYFPAAHHTGGYCPELSQSYQNLGYPHQYQYSPSSTLTPMTIENTIISRTTVPPGGNTLQLEAVPLAGHFSNEGEKKGNVILEPRMPISVPNSSKIDDSRAPAAGGEEMNYTSILTVGSHTLDTSYSAPADSSSAFGVDQPARRITFEEIKELVQSLNKVAPVIGGVKEEFKSMLSRTIGYRASQRMRDGTIASIQDLHTIGEITVTSENIIRVLFSPDHKSITLFSGKNSINKLKLDLASDPTQSTLLEAANTMVKECQKFREDAVMNHQPLSDKIPPLKQSHWPAGLNYKDAVAAHFTQSEIVKVRASKVQPKMNRVNHPHRAKKDAVPGFIHCILRSHRDTVTHHHLVKDDTKATKFILPETKTWSQILFESCTSDSDNSESCHATWAASSTRILNDGPLIQAYVSGQHIPDPTQTTSVCIHKQHRSRLTINGHAVHGGEAFQENQVAALFTLFSDAKITSAARHSGEISEPTFQALIGRIWTVAQHPVLEVCLPLFVFRQDKIISNHFLSAAIDPHHQADEILSKELLMVSNNCMKFLCPSGPLRSMLPSGPHIFQKNGSCQSCYRAHSRNAIDHFFREFIEINTTHRKFYPQGYIRNDGQSTWLPAVRLINTVTGNTADADWKPPDNLRIARRREDGVSIKQSTLPKQAKAQVEKAKSATVPKSHLEAGHPHYTRFKLQQSLSRIEASTVGLRSRQGNSTDPSPPSLSPHNEEEVPSQEGHSKTDK